MKDQKWLHQSHFGLKMNSHKYQSGTVEERLTECLEIKFGIKPRMRDLNKIATIKRMESTTESTMERIMEKTIMAITTSVQ